MVEKSHREQQRGLDPLRDSAVQHVCNTCSGSMKMEEDSHVKTQPWKVFHAGNVKIFPCSFFVEKSIEEKNQHKKRPSHTNTVCVQLSNESVSDYGNIHITLFCV
ncbi:hypothetical protein JOB18_008481 [Solea senegalensis]|uniref:Uncharacterized protein n=1 Tax=Solea senegalensis TaxID=28829 RepID=A0AAV6R9L4_SOLSE|nr:hypothetical protein JOB18_048477 [Solea senegalensis]KAG7501858.1 hypothetical protein JOB18_008481 [Solea senegalensis]